LWRDYGAFKKESEEDMTGENALKDFKATHASEIAATKAEFVNFLRGGTLPEESLDMVALYIYVGNRAMLQQDPKRTPIPAGDFFASVVQDGVYHCVEAWDNPKQHAALVICTHCDGEGYVPGTRQAEKRTAKTRTGSKLAGAGV
jgi:hypothetical protein